MLAAVITPAPPLPHIAIETDPDPELVVIIVFPR
jgi:hypothetical protein